MAGHSPFRGLAMRKLITLSAIVAIVALGWLLFPGFGAPPLSGKPVRLGDAELRYFEETHVGGDFGAPKQPARVIPRMIRWITTEDEVEGNSWDDLAAKLKAPAARKEADKVTHKLRVFNQLGAEGWELVGQQ